MDRKIVLGIDFNNIVFASYYGEKLINSKGTNVNAVKGFFFKLKMLKDMFNPDCIVMANDVSRSRTFRRKIYKQYKAQRKEHDPDMMKQLEYAARLTSLLGYQFINNETYEADDILGMMSRFVNERDMDMVIVSSDRDMYQLITDHTFIFSPRNKELIDRGWLYEKYKLTPEQWIELKMLQGDNSDNIPGIPGIGEITALKLMNQFGSIDNIYRKVDSLKPGLRDALKNGQNSLPLMRELVTIVTDYTKIDLNEDKMKRTEAYPDAIFDVLYDLELYSLFDIMRYSLIPEKEDT